MCGICGVAGGEPDEGRELVGRMCAAMVHRGPDEDGSIHRDGVTFGMRRLSIIDVQGGHQPIHNEDSTIWVVQNGEIYNHLELRKMLVAAGHLFTSQSDTEVLVHGYEEWGEALVERLNGMFAFAMLDLRRGRVLLARDRMGIKPLHYAVDGRRLVFASELKALLCDPVLRRDLDPIALDEYLALEFVPSPRSIVRGISKLPPAHPLEWWLGSGIHRLHRYWAPTLVEENRSRGRSLDEECEELRTVLRESVRKELISDVPLGVFLSGGIDSSAVTAMMSQLGTEVKSFSVGFAERSFDESRYARQVSKHLGTDHHELTLEPSMLLDLIPKLPTLLDEPLGDASIIPTYLLSAFTRRHVKVALGGDGGGEDCAPFVRRSRSAGRRRAREAFGARRRRAARSDQPGSAHGHAALPGERHPGQAGPREHDGFARGPRPSPEQRFRRVRDAAPSHDEAAWPAFEVPFEARVARLAARLHPQPSEEGFRDPRRGLVSRPAQRTDAVGARAGAHRAKGVLRWGGGGGARG